MEASTSRLPPFPLLLLPALKTRGGVCAEEEEEVVVILNSPEAPNSPPRAMQQGGRGKDGTLGEFPTFFWPLFHFLRSRRCRNNFSRERKGEEGGRGEEES